MTATNSTEPAKDGTGAAFNVTFAAESVSGNKAQATYIKSPSTEALVEPPTHADVMVITTALGTPAQDGTDGTGITPPVGAVGIRGWLSGIFNKLNTSIGVTGTFWQATQPISGAVALNDGAVTSQKATVAAFHAADNQAPGGTAFGLLTGGVAQLLNAVGNLDRQRETGQQNIPARGIATGTQQLKSPISTTVTAGGGAGTNTVTLAALKVTNNGQPAWIQPGSILTMESGTANQEAVYVLAANYGTLVCTIFGLGSGNGFQFTHAGASAVTSAAYNEAVDATTPEGTSGAGLSLGATTLFNSTLNAGAGGWENERSASGELDGAIGKGTAVAAEYEFNAGGPVLASGLASGFQFDRARSVQAKGLGSGAIRSSLVGNANIVLGSAAATKLIQPGQKIRLRGGAIKETVLATAAWVPGSSATVPLQSPVVNAAQTTAEWDVYAPSGPALAGFLADGVGIEEEALYDPVSDLFYVERAATQDAMPAQNIVAECPALWNGATMDRWPGDKTNGGFVNVKSSVLPTGAALDGTDATGVVPPTGATGIRGWLSAIYSAATGPIPTGASTIGAVTGPGAVALAKDASVTGLQVAQASTTAGQSGPLIQTASRVFAPSYSDSTTNPLSTDNAGNLRVVRQSYATTVTPVVTSNGAYSAGNEIGGLMSFPISPANGNIMNVRVTSKSILATNLNLYVFSTSPSNTTWTDKTAPNINTADIAGLVAVIPLTSPDSKLGTMTIWNSNLLSIKFTSGTGNLYCILVAISAATLTSASTSDFTVMIGAQQ